MAIFNNRWVSFVIVAFVFYLLALAAFHLTKQFWVLPYLLISQMAGHVFAGLLYSFAKNEGQAWSSVLTGLIERTFFFVVVANDVSGAAVAMIAWITLKNVMYISKYFTDQKNATLTDIGKRQNTTLLSSLVSLFFAMLAGLCIKSDSIRASLDNFLRSLVFA